MRYFRISGINNTFRDENLVGFMYNLRTGKLYGILHASNCDFPCPFSDISNNTKQFSSMCKSYVRYIFPYKIIISQSKIMKSRFSQRKKLKTSKYYLSCSNLIDILSRKFDPIRN